MSRESMLPEISIQTDFGSLKSSGNLLNVKVVRPDRQITFEGPDALLKTATFRNEDHLLDVVQDGKIVTIDAPPYEGDKVDWEFELEFDPAEKPMGKSVSTQTTSCFSL